MLISRVSRMSRLLPFVARRPIIPATRNISTGKSLLSGNMTWVYREYPRAPKSHFIAAEVIGAITWWWILWHCFTEYGHLIGEFDIPEESEWTDEELGIPPDDEDDPEFLVSTN